MLDLERRCALRSGLSALALVPAFAAGCDYDRMTPQRPEAPRLTAPRNGAYIGSVHRIGSRRPTLRWEQAELDGDGGAQRFYQLELSPL